MKINNEEIHPFDIECIEYLMTYVNFEQYNRFLKEEQRQRLKEKMTIMVCKAFAPKRRYDISKNEVREMVSHYIDALNEQAGDKT